ncbi:MAG: ribonuclease HII [Balneolaceae bacterium]|nr:ribonuclease HII [Balneolaceae bacterium]MBL6916125.1 ribonuclease HII [Balneolaceae bacterium]|tara:strand:+ start:1932 stop:2549 length:618 start_codon:yes stop_codon:yes gene_type:complete
MSRLEIERTLWQEGFRRIMGLDEVGRGCLAGPVVAAGVILDPNNPIEGIQDSKKLSLSERLRLSKEIKKKALYWTIQEGDLAMIDRLNILWASLETMNSCATSTGANPDYLLVDGNRYVPTLLAHQCIVKGDSKSASIGAASIIAKVYRDELMASLHLEFPEYGWDNNVGYPTNAHRQALKKYGYTPVHRTSFSLGTTKARSFKL